MVFQKNPHVNREEVVWNGKKYRRYPNAKQSSHRRYFSCAGSFLHRDVWRHYNGEIPDGHHIHHKDGDPFNNEITNLECISSKDHFSLHSEERSERGKNPRQLDHLRTIRSKAVEWHKSEEGRAWHRQNAVKSLEKARKAVRFSRKQDIVKKCDVCSKVFVTRNVRKILCSPACQSKKSKTKKRAALAL